MATIAVIETAVRANVKGFVDGFRTAQQEMRKFEAGVRAVEKSAGMSIDALSKKMGTWSLNPRQWKKDLRGMTDTGATLENFGMPPVPMFAKTMQQYRAEMGQTELSVAKLRKGIGLLTGALYALPAITHAVKGNFEKMEESIKKIPAFGWGWVAGREIRAETIDEWTGYNEKMRKANEQAAITISQWEKRADHTNALIDRFKEMNNTIRQLDVSNWKEVYSDDPMAMARFDLQQGYAQADEWKKYMDDIASKAYASESQRNEIHNKWLEIRRQYETQYTMKMNRFEADEYKKLQEIKLEAEEHRLQKQQEAADRWNEKWTEKTGSVKAITDSLRTASEVLYDRVLEAKQLWEEGWLKTPAFQRVLTQGINSLTQKRELGSAAQINPKGYLVSTGATARKQQVEDPQLQAVIKELQKIRSEISTNSGARAA